MGFPLFLFPKPIFEEVDEMRQTSEAKKSLRGYYGEYGGRFVPEAIGNLLDELEGAFDAAMADGAFVAEMDRLLGE